MASGYDTEKTPLKAMFKMDFYKNKKNWKLYEGRRKEPPLLKTNVLNVTYSVGDSVPQQESGPNQSASLHDQAFLCENTSDPPVPPPSQSGPPSPAAPGEYTRHSWPDQPYREHWTEPVWQDTQQEYLDASVEYVPEQLAYDQCDGAWHPHVWEPDPVSDTVLQPALDPLDLPLPSLAPLHPSHPALQGEPACCLDSLDDSADFMRGAHLAPHSTELDLTVSKGKENTKSGHVQTVQAFVSYRVAQLRTKAAQRSDEQYQKCSCAEHSLHEWSRRQLECASRRHHAALVSVLREISIRDALVKMVGPPQWAPEPLELPTRDTDPVPGGRGRGRLQQARALAARSVLGPRPL